MMKQRLKYFDMMKGLAIFTVVMGHVLTMCVRDVDKAPVFKFIGEIHMPLFFFISGWFAVKLTESGRLAAPSLLSRARRLLLPMLGASTLWIYYFPVSGLQSPFDSTWSGLWLNEWKNGYWFTFVLFGISAVYTALVAVLRHFPSFLAGLIIALAAWIIIGVLYYTLPPVWVSALSIELIFTFFPVFMAGVLARRHSSAFMRLCASSGAVTVSLLATALCMAFVCWPWKYSFGTSLNVVIARIILHISLVIIVLAAVRPWSERAFDVDRTRPARFAALWAFLGDKSLAIYLLHYFFLFPMPFMRPWLEAFDLALVPLTVFAAIVAIPVVALSVCADYVLSFSAFFRTFLTGSAAPSK